MKEWASDLFKSEAWRESARKRIIAGKAPHLEAHCLQVLMPKTDKTDLTTNGEAIKQIVNNYVAPAPTADASAR